MGTSLTKFNPIRCQIYKCLRGQEMQSLSIEHTVIFMKGEISAK